jgi:hypothetical protein
VLHGQAETQYSDVWAFGLVTWEVLTQSELFPEVTGGFLCSQLKHLLDRGERPPLPANLDPELTSLLISCWSPRLQTVHSFLKSMSGFFKSMCASDIRRSSRTLTTFPAKLLRHSSARSFCNVAPNTASICVSQYLPSARTHPTRARLQFTVPCICDACSYAHAHKPHTAAHAHARAHTPTHAHTHA